MKNTLTDLNAALFAQLSRLTDESVTGEDLDREIRRSEAITDVAESILKNGELSLKAMKHAEEYGYMNSNNRVLPALLQTGEE